MKLQGRRVLLGISGGIAAYKTPQLLRALLKEGAEVRVVMTAAAQRFVTPYTLEVLSRHPVHTEMFVASQEFPVLHVGLAQWAELVVLAPATAHLLARLACGLADDLLTTLMLGCPAPVLAAPSMEERMLDHPLTQEHLRRLEGLGYQWAEPATGELASGAFGRGRMAEPEEIAGQVVRHFAVAGDLQGVKVLVSAGPTVEDLDPVRFIGNRSSGKMGYALATQAQRRGAQVWLISGPTALTPPAGVEFRGVRSTLEMQGVLEELFPQMDAAILAAAVADYRPAQVAPQKLKRGTGKLVIELVENPDLSAELGRRKQRHQVLIGFAMETEEGLARAREKRRRKNCDLMVLNNLREEGAGFGVDTNIVTLIEGQGAEQALPKMSKLQVADRILDWLRQRRLAQG
ncbi:MAG: bifunctional phosphopantothenoylcysteine decarboxylase/phosphopantothenate--cysteine ligase CoaBC [Candidatus Latescibacteria bacterium]|nr:bifunctional phosphopantothenoylcysteine decarboxylase/phosphopantothenate--cysteine ligase CoaBC [Candidatus Latescibacterota bacterium]